MVFHVRRETMLHGLVLGVGLALIATVGAAAPPAPPEPADEVRQEALASDDPAAPENLSVDRREAEILDSAMKTSAALREAIDGLLPETNGLLESRLFDARARTLALERDFRALTDVRGDAVHERFNSACNRAIEMAVRLKFAWSETPPPPEQYDVLVDLANRIEADARQLASRHIPASTADVAYIANVSPLDFDVLRDGVGQLTFKLSRFLGDKSGDARKNLEITLNSLASSERDLRTAQNAQGLYVVERLDSVADRLAGARDHLSDMSGHFDDVPRAQLETMRGEAERLHNELRAIMEGRAVRGPAALVKDQRARVANLSAHTSALMVGKKSPALDDLEAARDSLAQLYTDLGDVIDAKGELLPDRIAQARAELTPIKTKLADAGANLDDASRDYAKSISTEIDRMDADLAAMARPRTERTARQSGAPRR